MGWGICMKYAPKCVKLNSLQLLKKVVQIFIGKNCRTKNLGVGIDLIPLDNGRLTHSNAELCIAPNTRKWNFSSHTLHVRVSIDQHHKQLIIRNAN